MSEQSQKNGTPRPLTRAEKRAAKRARQAAWRQSPQGRRHAANVFEAHRARIESHNANLPPVLYDVLNAGG